MGPPRWAVSFQSYRDQHDLLFVSVVSVVCCVVNVIFCVVCECVFFATCIVADEFCQSNYAFTSAETVSTVLICCSGSPGF